MALVSAGVLLFAFRERLLLALVVALALGIEASRRQRIRAAPSAAPVTPATAQGHVAAGCATAVRARRHFAEGLAPVVRQLGDISYALFLVHFPVCLVINAAFTRFVPPTVPLQSLGLAIAFAASVALAAVFHARVEKPLLRLLGRPAVPSKPQAPLTARRSRSPFASRRIPRAHEPGA